MLSASQCTKQTYLFFDIIKNLYKIFKIGYYTVFIKQMKGLVYYGYDFKNN